MFEKKNKMNFSCLGGCFWWLTYIVNENKYVVRGEHGHRTQGEFRYHG